MIRLSYPDPREPILHDGWTANWTIAPATIRELRGGQHALQAPEARAVSLCELRGGSAAFQALKLYSRYLAAELPDHDLPSVLTADTRREDLHHWLWTLPAYDAGVRVLGAAGFHLRTDVPATGPFVALTWAWLHPLARHLGLFRAAWHIFIRRYRHIQVAQPTTALRVCLVGKPTVTLGTQEPYLVQVYTQDPECRAHGAMLQIAAGQWACHAKLDGSDENYCKARWPAPAPAHQLQETASCLKA